MRRLGRRLSLLVAAAGSMAASCHDAGEHDAGPPPALAPAPAGPVPLPSLTEVPLPVPVPAPRSTRVVRAYVKQAACKCHRRHGIAHVVHADGRDEPLALDKLAFEVRVAPDHATVGVLLGEHLDDPALVPEPLVGRDELVLVREGRVLHRLDVGPFSYAWAFVRRGREVATESGALHGPTWYTRFDVATGGALETLYSLDLLDHYRPSWVKAVDPSP